MSEDSTPPSSNWVPVDFDKAELQPGSVPGSLVLVVSGNTSSSSSRGCPVKLVPATYVTQPDYWRVEVLWDRAHAIFQSECPFSVFMPLDGIRGRLGIELIGKTASRRLAT